jgi:flagellar hook-associated protein 1 FlgK
MGGLLSVLGGAGGSLQAALGAAATASNNLENVNTPGYARQQANIVEGGIGEIAGTMLGGGSYLTSVTQVRSSFIEEQLPGAFGQAAYSSAQSNGLQAIAAFDTDNTSGISNALPAFFSALQALSANPGDPSLRTAAIGAATQLAQSFNSASQEITTARDGLDQQASGNIAQINQLASQVASLNQQVAVAKGSGAQPNALLDARQRAQDQLEQLTGARPVADSSGNVNLELPGGGPLVVGNQASQLSTVVDPTNNGHLAVQIQTSPAAKPITLPSGALGGTLGGTLAARDGALKQAESGLDNLAFGLAQSFNAIQSAGYGTDGSTGNNFFDVGPTAAGAAGQIAVDPALTGNPAALAAASAPGASGDGSNLQKMLAIEGQPIAGGASPSDALGTLVSSFGAASQTATLASQNDAALQAGLVQQRDSVSGVSSNEEQLNLTQAQQAYEAVSQVVQTTNTMLNVLMSMTTITAA